MLKAITIIAAVATAGAGVAAPARLTDVQFIQAARCEALIGSPALGGGDTAAIKALIKSQRGGRVDYIFSKADDAERAAEREARHASDYTRTKLIAERDGVCQAFLPQSQTQTAGGRPQPNTAN